MEVDRARLSKTSGFTEIMKRLSVLSLYLILLSGVSVISEQGCPNGSTCVYYQQCASLRGQQNGTFTYRCGSANQRVCCPPAPSTGSRRTTTSRPPPRPPTKNKVTDPSVNKRLLPNDDCGENTADKIINGELAELGQFPWMALLAFRLNASSPKTDFLCGGTLINERYVLTAAHCVKNAKAGLPVSVRLGEHNLTTAQDCNDLMGYCADPPVNVEVEKVIIHNNYNRPHQYLKNDIALLRLKRSVNRTTYINSICLPFHINITGEEEQKYTAAGWGKTDYSNENGSDALLYAHIWTSPLTECNAAQAEEVKPLDQTQLCAGGTGGFDACKGDSGGPLMHNLPDPNGGVRTYQLGIVSFGTVPCGAEGTPSVYTRVTAYLNWILLHLEP